MLLHLQQEYVWLLYLICILELQLQLVHLKGPLHGGANEASYENAY